MDTSISPNGVERRFKTEPLYIQLRNDLVSRIQGGEWKPGLPIPNEGDLAREYQVSSGTMRKSLDLMEAQRFIDRKQGRGTFVCEQVDWENLPDAAKAFLAAIGGGAVAPDRYRIKTATSRFYTLGDLRRLADGALELAAWLERRAPKQARAA